MFSLRHGIVAVAVLALLAFPAFGAPAASAFQEPEIGEYLIPDDVMCKLREQWLADIAAKYPEGTWAPMKMTLNDEQLAMMGLPSTATLIENFFEEPTVVHPGGEFMQVALPSVASYAGAGCFGIRPGAWVLLINGGSIGWCSLAHVFGSPGSYDISTAGHCGKNGDRAIVIAAFSPTGNPVLLDFGKFAQGTGDGGIGRDWALIDIYPSAQHLVSPTMCFWGGPNGTYTKTGTLAGLAWSRRGVTPIITPDAGLAQTILHYGHGTGVGAGGTPRVGEAIDWRGSYFTWFGAISPGDSGSGSNAVGVGALNAAAGINTHIYVEGQVFKTGTGYLASTRITEVGTPTNGQLVPYPVPLPGAP